eukprot:10413697-Karenia_brevis.AAC.1
MLGLKADVSKAHRRCGIWAPDQKWQVCRTRPGSVWVNTVGTFGIGSAGYWWARLGGGTGRVVHSLMHGEEFWLFLFADDFDFLA